MPIEIRELTIKTETRGDTSSSQETTSTRPTIGAPATCQLSIGGSQIQNLISRVELRQSIDDHHILIVTIRQVAEAADDSSRLEPSDFSGYLGNSISITMPLSIEGQPSETQKLEFTGTVTELHFDNSVDATDMIHIIAASPTISMDGAKNVKFFKDQKDSDIVRSIVGDNQITAGSIDATSETSDFCVQYHETDMRFVRRLATRNGMFAYYDGKKFYVKKAESSAALDATWPENLGAFAMSLGTGQIEHRSVTYNYEQKKTLSKDSKSITSSTSLSPLARKSQEASSKIFKGSGFRDYAMIKDTKTLDGLLGRERSRSIGNMMAGTGKSILPQMTVGMCVQVNGLGSLNGKYFILKVTHQLDDSGSYFNEFKCIPVEAAFPEYDSSRPKVTQLQSAVVTDNEDEEMKLGRVKVKFPWTENDETTWARLVHTHAGENRGFYWLPEVGDEVLVGYEHGNPDHPIVLGSLYNKTDKPVAPEDIVDNNTKSIVTKAGNEITINDKAGEETIQISNKDGQNQIVLTLDGPKIDITSDGDITLSGKNIKIEASEKLEMTSAQDASLKSQANVKIEATANIEEKATGNYDMKGALVNVKGNMINLN